MTFTPKEVILGASVPLENGGSVTFSIAGHVETERDYDDAVVIFSRKLLKYTNCATDEDRLTVRQVVSSITSTPLDKVPDVRTPAPIPPPVEPVKTPLDPPPKQVPGKVWVGRDSSKVARLDEPAKTSPPTAAEQAAAAVAQCIKPPAPSPAPSAPPVAKASASTTPPDTKTAPLESFGICAECGEAVPQSQAKLSQIFMSKTLCKACMEAGQR
jgi:hypothetical protein